MEGGEHVIELVAAVVGLLLVAAATHVASKRSGIPFTVALVVVGVILAHIGELGLGWVEPVLEPMVALEISPEVVFFVFLPTLIFESAFNLDARSLRANLLPVLTLAVPGLLISTGLIGGILMFGAPLVGVQFTQAEALLLGCILSATDPVAVISLFRQLGAPKRLTILVEGESLFNDATAIVLSRIILAFIVGGGIAAAGGGLGQTALLAGLEFAKVFFGGFAVGWAAAVVVGMVLGKVEDDAFIEITLTTILAYFAFYLAEEAFHLSGVMAVVAAGVLIGGWGKAKISPEVAGELEHFWEYIAAVANSLIFLLVGLRVDLGALADSLGMLTWVVGAMLVSRALVIYLLVPLAGRVSEPVDRPYQAVMYWGGLRGAVALAIALSLPTFPNRDPEFFEFFVALVTGAVLFTLLVQGLTIERLVKHFGLDKPPLSDRVARIEGILSAKDRTIEQLPELQAGGLFSAHVAYAIRKRCEDDLDRLRAELEELRARELDEGEERRLLFLRCFAEETTRYYLMFSRGHLAERSYRNLAHSIAVQAEAIRHGTELPDFTLHPPTGERFGNLLHRALDRVPGMQGVVERLRAERTVRDYEVAWGRYRGSERVLRDLDDLAAQEATRASAIEEVQRYYEGWRKASHARLDQMAEQFPEFVSSTQERLADRLVLHAEREAIGKMAHAGMIPHGVAETMLEELGEELIRLRATPTGKLEIEPEELLRKVPFFQDLPQQERDRVVKCLRRRTAPAGDVIVRQGSTGDSLYLIARGVVRVSRQDGGLSRDLATLVSSEFFGEMALLHGGRRTATCRAVTPCALYELRRADLDAALDASPAMREALELADRERRAALRKAGPPTPED